MATRTRPARAADRSAQISLERRRLVTVWLVVLACLAVVPHGFDRFVFAKLLLVAVAGVLAGSLPREARLPRPVSVVVLVGFVLLVLAALVGDTPVASLVGRWPRYEGLPVLGLYVAAAWVGARVVGRGPARALHLAHAMSGMSLVLFVFSFLDVVGASPLGASAQTRSGSLLGNATDQGTVAMMTAVVVAAALTSRRDPLLVSGLVSALATVAFSGSRTALILTAVTLVLFGLVRNRRLVPAAIGLVAVMAVVALAVPVTRDRLLDGATASGRLTQWRLTLHLVADHPWLGLGPNRYVDAFGRYESPAFVRFTGPDALADSPHQVLLQAVLAGGIPLLLCFLIAVVVVMRRAAVVLRAHPEAWGPALAVAAYGAAMLVNFTSAGPTCLAAFLLGGVLAEAVTDPEPTWRRAGLGVVFGLAAVAMLMASVSEILLQQGVSAAASRHRGDAYAGITAAQRWRPLDSDVAMLGSQALAATVSAGDAKSAQRTVDLADDSLARTPDTYNARVALGVGLISQGHYAAAESDLDLAVRLFPQRPAAYVQRALARYAQEDVAGARADLRAALAITPRSTTVKRLLDQIG